MTRSLRRENRVVSGLPGAFYSIIVYGLLPYLNSKRSILHDIQMTEKPLHETEAGVWGCSPHQSTNRTLNFSLTS